MKAAALIISYVLIGILAFFVFMNHQEIKRLEALIPPIPPIPPIVPENTASEVGRTSVRAGELWKELQKSIGEMNIDLTFKNNNV